MSLDREEADGKTGERAAYLAEAGDPQPKGGTDVTSTGGDTENITSTIYLTRWQL